VSDKPFSRIDLIPDTSEPLASASHASPARLLGHAPSHLERAPETQRRPDRRAFGPDKRTDRPVQLDTDSRVSETLDEIGGVTALTDELATSICAEIRLNRRSAFAGSRLVREKTSKSSVSVAWRADGRYTRLRPSSEFDLAMTRQSPDVTGL
jgi:hypothetical protein